MASATAVAIPAYSSERTNCVLYVETAYEKLPQAQPKLKSGKSPCERAIFPR